MKKGMKGIGTLLLAGALAASMLPGLPGVKAAVAVDPDTKCSLEISIGNDYTDDLTAQEVTVNLYRVADINASGKYTAAKAFEPVGFDKVSASTSADDWSGMASTAAGIVEDDGSLTADAVITIAAEKTSGTATGLKTGLYLIVPQDVTTANYTYSFDPSLVSLPNNYYDSTVADSDDSWVYELTGEENAVTLKPEQTARLGNLTLTKNLTGWSSTAGSSAMFIFEISYTAPDETTDTWQEAMTFTGTGEQSLTITNIPAGSNVTVEEIYSGAAYTVVGDSMVETSIEADETAEVTITNEHNNTPNGGTGIINHYTTENGKYTNPTNPDSTGGRVVVEEEETEAAQPLT